MRLFSLFFITIVLCFSLSAQARHAFTISYVNLPENESRLKYLLEKNDYAVKKLTDSDDMAQILATSIHDDKKPNANFLVTLFTHGFIHSIQPLPKPTNRIAWQIRISENLTREQLAQFINELQLVGAWPEYGRLTPLFNIILNFEPQFEEAIKEVLRKYDFAEQYHTDIEEDLPQTHFLKDHVRRGISTIVLRFMIKGMGPTVLKRIPQEFIDTCIVDLHEKGEFERMVFTCPNEFRVLHGIVDAIGRLVQSQAVTVETEGEYATYEDKRDSSAMIETLISKRLVLEPRPHRAMLLARKSEEFKKMQQQSEDISENELVAMAFKLGVNILRQWVLDHGYSAYKLQSRYGNITSPVQQIFIELPESGISKEALDSLLLNFRIFKVLQNGKADQNSEIKSVDENICEDILTPKS